MECPSCFLRYSASQRKPKVVSCGHTVCQLCLKKAKKCRICGTVINPDKNYALNFSLMEIIEKDSKEIDKYIKVCFVGSSTTGKTTLIKRMMGNEFNEETVTTIGYDFSFQDRVVNQLQIRYQLWDSAGQEKYRAISPIHFRNADIVVVVYDLAQKPTDNKVCYWIEEALKNSPENAKIVIVGNKLDLAPESKVHKPMDEQSWNMILKSDYQHLEISCKTCAGIVELWESFEQELIKRMQNKKVSMIQYEKELEELEKKRTKISKIKKKEHEGGSVLSKRVSSSSTCC